MRLDAPAVYVADTGTAKGRGVFALRAFASGAVVEECAVIVVGRPHAELPPELRTVAYNWAPGSVAIACGFGSLYNHDNPANLRYLADGEGRTLRYLAVREIAAGEELTINYNATGGGHIWFVDSWFARNQITRI